LMEEGQFDIPEIARMNHETATVSVRTADGRYIPIEKSGVIKCDDFPIVIMTTNEERDFSAAFTRRCLKLHMDLPDEQKLQDILSAHITDSKLLEVEETKNLVAMFLGQKSEPATRISVDRLINAIHLLGAGRLASKKDREGLVQAVLGTK
jgi:MoxR-like ATPase